MPDVPHQRADAAGEPLRLLHVHAHPDDESSKGAASTARYVAEGVDVVVATCTGGERGSILNPKLEGVVAESDIAEVRRAEMDEARRILGIKQVWLGFVDSGFPEGNPPPPLDPGCFASLDVAEAAKPLIRVIREFRPHVVTTYDERGGYPHPDHIMCHKVSMAAVETAATPEQRELGEPWRVPKLYYHTTFHRRRLLAFDAAVRDLGLTSPYADRLAQMPNDDNAPRPTTFVECADYFEVRDSALLAHATQVDPDGMWFAIPRDVQRAAWPTEDYQLVRSAVPVSLPEEDLFAGIADAGTVPAAWLFSAENRLPGDGH